MEEENVDMAFGADSAQANRFQPLKEKPTWQPDCTQPQTAINAKLPSAYSLADIIVVRVGIYIVINARHPGLQFLF